jgi:hypothetical protein
MIDVESKKLLRLAARSLKSARTPITIHQLARKITEEHPSISELDRETIESASMLVLVHALKKGKLEVRPNTLAQFGLFDVPEWDASDYARFAAVEWVEPEIAA